MTQEQVRNMFADRALKAVDILAEESRGSTPEAGTRRVVAAAAASISLALLQLGDEVRRLRECLEETTLDARLRTKEKAE